MHFYTILLKNNHKNVIKKDPTLFTIGVFHNEEHYIG